MRAGELRHRVIIEQPTTFLGQWGQETSWRQVAKVWANVKPTSGGEKFDSTTKGVDAAIAFEVRMRFRSDIKSNWRFNHEGRVLDLVSVLDPDGRRRELVVTCVQHGFGECAA